MVNILHIPFLTFWRKQSVSRPLPAKIIQQWFVDRQWTRGDHLYILWIQDPRNEVFEDPDAINCFVSGIHHFPPFQHFCTGKRNFTPLQIKHTNSMNFITNRITGKLTEVSNQRAGKWAIHFPGIVVKITTTPQYLNHPHYCQC